ncbi:unnamed protein product [Spirodela intermedia]|uniref:Uncharacterized protein n=1 Tax=Spirodela intermedia TaxID=51605 RepID=A0A7I8IH25_SPIIN|nr:unnamed protein product [Spirodela intermedia]CAA6657183.1 unnamed protein product [Spirodela intermedia]CAA6674121.1 unnamed protein product [Spirodela intermedia]
MEVGHVSGSFILSQCNKRRLFIASAAGDDSTTHFIGLQTSREDLEIAHVVFVQGEPSRPKILNNYQILYYISVIDLENYRYFWDLY